MCEMNTIGFFSAGIVIKSLRFSGTFNPILLPVEIKNFALVWKIVSDGKSLFYQTDQHVIQIKENKAVKVHPFKGFVRCIFEVNKDIYFVDKSQIVYVYRDFRVEYGFEHRYYFFFYFKLGHIRFILVRQR